MRRGAWSAIFICVVTAFTAQAELRRGAPLPVRILYDNSGSMFPGYRPPGSPDRHSRQELGVAYFHQIRAFAEWLDDFAQRQTMVDAGTIGMWTFTSDEQFTPADLHAVHPVVPAGAFNVSTAIANFPERVGDNTYLTETLHAFTRDYTGLVWLITDNIVETNAGQPDDGVRAFLETLSREEQYRSVHLFKYSLQENGQTGTLAVYAILVSAANVPDDTLAYYDERLRALSEAKRRTGNPPADLFPERNHLKLKNLRIRPLIPDLRLVLSDLDKGIFKEGQSVELMVQGKIRSFLTQHSVTSGRYELAIVSPFVPEAWARRDLGAQPLTPQLFDSISGQFGAPIPPLGTREVEEQIRSNQPISFSPSGVAEWLRLAWSGAAVRYTGTARMSFNDVKVRLEPQRMAGIFGIDQVATVFRFQDITTLDQVTFSVVPVSFALQTGPRRTWILLAILVVLAALLFAAAILLTRKQSFRIEISNGPKTTTALRRFGRHDVTLEGKLLGRLSRGLANSYEFDPARNDNTFTVVPSGEGEWDVRFAAGGMRRLSIKAEGGSRPSTKKPAPAASRGAPPPPPPVPRIAPPPGPPPKIGRF